MKRIGNINGVQLYDIICSRDNVQQAIKLACRDHSNDQAVIKIKQNPEPYIDAICEILKNKQFHYSKFKTKDIFERGKFRHLVFTRTFPDRIVQHAVFNIVAPILHGSMIDDQYQAIKERGIHKCSMKIRKNIQDDWRHTWFCLKIDVSKYFDNINRYKLYDMIKLKIKDRDTLNILYTMIFDVPGDKGLPIGLFSSQILSVFYLNGLDHFCKERLRIKYYYRYMDDIVILASNKNLLHNYLRFIVSYIDEIDLKLKKNYAIFPIEKRRLDFVGFVYNHKEVQIRKRTVIQYKRSCYIILNHIKNHKQITPHMLMSKQSYEGIILWQSTNNLYQKYNTIVDIALEFGVEAL